MIKMTVLFSAKDDKMKNLQYPLLVMIAVHIKDLMEFPT